jgi:type II secretory pathway pseudopilin PulG
MERRIANGRKAGRRSQRGFLYVALLIGLAIIGGGLAAVSTVWHTMVQREQEKQLIFVGNQFRVALNRYYQRNQRYPLRLEQLVEDDGQLVATRYLRKVYFDPVTGKKDWAAIKLANGQIVGVHSASQEAPLKSAGFRPRDAAFKEAKKYAEWMFVAEGQAAVGAVETLKPDALKLPTIQFK